jgi:hypothetical protein
MNAEQQDQERRHQRPAAYTGHPDKQADTETRCDVERINHGWWNLSSSRRSRNTT